MLAGCGGSSESPKPETIRGVNLFYLWDKYQDIPYILRTFDTPQTQQDLDEILTKLKDANVNAIRLLVAADHIPLNKLPDTWPTPAEWQTDGLKKLVDKIYGMGFKVSITFVGRTVDAKNAEFISAAGDLQWFNAFLAKLNKDAIIRVNLSGDWLSCGTEGCEISEYQKNHANYMRDLWPNRPKGWPTAYEFWGPNNYTTTQWVKNQIEWVKKNTPDAPMTIGFYDTGLEDLNLYSGEVFIDEYGYADGDPQKYKAFLQYALCEKKWPVFAWTAGVGWFGYGLFDENKQPTEALKAISEVYGKCKER